MLEDTLQSLIIPYLADFNDNPFLLTPVNEAIEGSVSFNVTWVGVFCTSASGSS